MTIRLKRINTRHIRIAIPFIRMTIPLKRINTRFAPF
jgi:hypothetical protein